METLVAALTVFVLAVFVGFEIITKIPPTLHTPLMSGSNAISGITLIGALLAAGLVQPELARWLGFAAIIFQGLGRNPEQIEFPVVVQSGMLQRFTHREVRIFQFHVFSHEGNVDRLTRCLGACRQFLPLAQLRRLGTEAQLVYYEFPQPFLFQDKRYFVDSGYRR